MADERIAWRSADGVEVELLAGEAVDVLWGVEGRGLPRHRFAADALAGVDGEVLRSVRRRPRRITLPALIVGDTRGELRDRLRELARQLDPMRGAGQLRVTGYGLDVEVDAYLEDGLELEETLEAGLFAQRAELTFVAWDPLWRDAVPAVEEIAVAQPVFLPLPPLEIAASAAIRTFTIDNDGDADTYPRITAFGPGEDLRLRNVDLGLELDLDGVTVADSERVEIDAHPLRQTIELVDADGGRKNLWPDASPSTVLWPIRRGVQTVEGRFEGTEPGVSNVRVQWRVRRLVA